MKVLSAAELLTIWECGCSQPSFQRALLLLSAVYPNQTTEQLAQLSLGQRDAQLLTLREKTLGSQIASLVSCPNCGNSLELNFAVSDILVPNLLEQTNNLLLETEDYEIEFRLPNSLDLAKVIHLSDVSAVASQLLKHCILSSKYQNQPVTVEEIPAQIIQALIKQMEQADPQADISLDLNCPHCGHQWLASFDILTFFWQEITAWVQRILREVHSLASAYGWREADILAMSPQRRQIYLEMINS